MGPRCAMANQMRPQSMLGLSNYNSFMFKQQKDENLENNNYYSNKIVEGRNLRLN